MEQEEYNKQALELIDKMKESEKPAIPQEDNRNIITDSREETLNDIQSSEEFKKFTKNLWEQETYAEGEKQAIAIARVKMQNEYDTYALEQEKKALAEQMKYEKNLVREQAKAKVMLKKMEIAKDRYGYLYPLLDEDGKPILDDDGNPKIDMSKFTPNKLSNKFREWEFNYSNLSKTSRNVIKTTVKTILIIGGIALGGYVLYELGAWLLPLLGNLA